MRCFLDSGNIDEIQSTMNSFNIEGITTNPKLSTISNAKQILKKFRLPTSIQPDPRNLNRFMDEVSELIEDNMTIIKVPINYPSIIKKLVDMSIPVNCTLCFTLSQIINAANLRADYVSIFVGRMIEQGMDAAKLIKDATTYLKSSDQQTKIIAASIRSLGQMELAAISGAHIITVAPKLLLSASTHPMTEAGNIEFWGS